MTIVGTATFGEVEGIPGFTVVAADDATAQAMFAQPGSYDSIVVASRRHDDQRRAGHRRSQAAVGSDDLEIITGDADTADKQADVQGGHELLQHVPPGLRLHRPVRRHVHHLQHLLDHHRPAHAGDGDAPSRRRQPPAGAASGAVGVGHRRRRSPRRSAWLAGVGMSFGLRALLGAVGLEIPSGDVVITSGTVITAFVVGVSVTLFSSIGPALKASRIKPIAALRDTAIEDTNASLKRTVFGLAITGAGVVAFAAGIAGSGPERSSSSASGVLLAHLRGVRPRPGDRPSRR